MPPLSEVSNQSRRPFKVYGRRRGLPETREDHRQLFGTDENDENQIEKGLAQLSLSSKSIPEPIKTASSPLQATRPLPRSPSSPQKSLRPCAEQTPDRPPTPSTSHLTISTALKRQRSNYQHASSVPLTPSQQHQLAPLLSQPNVHPTVVSFPTFASRLLSKFHVSKSGEGSFSECLLLTHKTNPTDVAILKIIPFDLSSPTTASTTSTTNVDSSITNSPISSVLREVQILSTLSSHHGFAQLRSCHVVRGPWHPGFLSAYHAYRTSHPDLAINPLPSERWGEDMIYGVIEMDDAGRDLESLVKPNAFQVYDAFWMSVVLLGVVERECEFEHRDLHMSNICYRERVLGKGLDVGGDVAKVMKKEPDSLLGLTNLKITIIDYTMSRVRLEASGEEREGRILFNPESAWSGSGDDSELGDDALDNHQALTGHRMRRLAIQHSSSLSPSTSPPPNKWSPSLPQTNIFWLAHLLFQLLEQAGARPRHIPGSNAYAKKLQTRIWKGLMEVLAFIDRDDPDVGSTVELLSMGIEKGWIREGDLEGFKRVLNEES